MTADVLAFNGRWIAASIDVKIVVARLPSAGKVSKENNMWSFITKEYHTMIPFRPPSGASMTPACCAGVCINIQAQGKPRGEDVGVMVNTTPSPAVPL
jgi:hypothetical protein